MSGSTYFSEPGFSSSGGLSLEAGGRIRRLGTYREGQVGRDWPRLALTGEWRGFRLSEMEVRFKPETESRLNELASQSGRAASELVEDALAAYLNEVSELRSRLDTRYEEAKDGSAKLIDGKTFFEELRRRENELSHRRSTK